MNFGRYPRKKQKRHLTKKLTKKLIGGFGSKRNNHSL